MVPVVVVVPSVAVVVVGDLAGVGFAVTGAAAATALVSAAVTTGGALAGVDCWLIDVPLVAVCGAGAVPFVEVVPGPAVGSPLIGVVVAACPVSGCALAAMAAAAIASGAVEPPEEGGVGGTFVGWLVS
ncbi:MAG TPA: hypothetical protein VNY53_20900 [Bradyrhizobium sp.]|nr:hypothetical protein [Bradyrhizobium sp.]